MVYQPETQSIDSRARRTSNFAPVENSALWTLRNGLSGRGIPYYLDRISRDSCIDKKIGQARRPGREESVLLEGEITLQQTLDESVCCWPLEGAS